MVNVSVIIPIFNTEDYLHKCIQSVLSQRGVSLQLFLVDDGSSDSSLNIARYYQSIDSRIVLIMKKNEGQGIARNFAMKLAESEYIYFVDSDDFLVGEDTLKILYETAQENDLDICSPSVPDHYFNKPLEHIACLPCKSQFIKSSIIKRYEIYQPDIRSGQDGVFSHLVLLHSKKVGMAKKAHYHYIHAREGSTFASYLKRTTEVVGIVRKHYEAIVDHYNKFDLWGDNAVRLLSFIESETMKNRIDPHFDKLSLESKRELFDILSSVVSKCFDASKYELDEYCGESVKFIKDHNVDFLTRNYIPGRHAYSANIEGGVIESEEFIISTFSNRYFKDISREIDLKVSKSVEQKVESKVVLSEEKFDAKLSSLHQEIKQLRNKLDFAINTINNNKSSLRSKVSIPNKDLREGNSELVVSLTTLPHRMGVVHHSIESIFSQSLLPAKVVLWVTDKLGPDFQLSSELKALVNRGLDIKQVRDVGPHTKLLYALQEFGDKSIVTVDDDIIYPENMLECLWNFHQKHPGAVIGNWVRELAFDKNGEVLGIREGKLLTPPTLENEIEQAHRFEGEKNILGFPYGTSGVLYPPGSLHENVFNESEFTELCPKEDDIWFKAMSLMNGTPVVATNLGINPKHYCILGSQHEALRFDNHGAALNKVQMQKVFEYYDLYSNVQAN